MRLTAAALLLLCTVTASAAIRLPHVTHGSINLRPYGCMALMGATFWHNRVYVGGMSTVSSGPNTWCIDASNPDSLVYASGAGTGIKSYALDAQDGRIYGAVWGSGFRVLDASSNLITQIGEYSPTDGGAYWHLAVNGDRAYVSDRTETRVKFLVFDISNPTSPQLLSTLYTLNRPNGLSVRGSYAYLADSPYLTIVNVSNDLAPAVASRTYIGGLVHWALLRGDYCFVFHEDVLTVYDVSDPTAPVQVGSCGTYGGFHDGSPCMLGSYIFAPSGGNGMMTFDISNPANPRLIGGANENGLELSITGNGRYVYMANLAGDYEGTVYAVDAFDSDPDTTPPAKWSDFVLADASWDTEYLGDLMPSTSDPQWKLAAGSDESLASASGGSLRINDNSATQSVSWSRNWDARNTRGATVLLRASCASYAANGDSPDNFRNLTIEDGRFKEEFSIFPNGIRAIHANLQYLLTASQPHTYRITTQGAQFKVYVDEQPLPVITGPLSIATTRARVTFGATSGPGTQDITFDSVQCCSDGIFPPAARTNDQTPDVRVSVSDFVHNDSVSGIDPATAQYSWSTDGGITWNPSGWECRYEAAALPTASSPAWTVAEGAESYASIISPDLLRVNDNSIASGSKVKWSRAWGANPATGTTVLARARCASASGDTTYSSNIFIEDGAHTESLKILPDRLVLANSGQTVMLDGTQWHTFRLTTKGTQLILYVDETPTPALTETMTAPTTNNRIMFGSGASGGMQEIYFDYVYYSARGDLAPGQSGGAGQPASCTGQPGDYSATITASAVPFSHISDTDNKIRFAVRDVAGNLAYSPVYNVRIDPTAGPRVTNVTSAKPDGGYRSSATIDVQVTFSEPVIVTGSPRVELETGANNRFAGVPTGSGANTLTFSYYVQTGDVSPDLDCAGTTALQLNGGTIKSYAGADAFLTLPQPGAVGSLSYNKNLVIDAEPPRVQNVTSQKPNGVYKAGEQFEIIVAFNEAVNVTGTPQLELETGAADRKANYLWGSGTSTLAFAYTAQPGDVSPDLDYKATSSLALNGGTLKDQLLNNAVLTLKTPGIPGSLANGKDLALIPTDGSIRSAKQATPGSSVTLGDKALYLKQGTFGYIEEPDRTCGIRIEGASDAPAGSLVCLRGTLQTTPGGEPYLAVDLVTPHGILDVKPLGVSNRALASSLLNGLYVTAWGRVLSDPVDNVFWITDGSTATGIKVICDGAPGVSAGQYVTVCGAAGFDDATVIYR